MAVGPDPAALAVNYDDPHCLYCSVPVRAGALTCSLHRDLERDPFEAEELRRLSKRCLPAVGDLAATGSAQDLREGRGAAGIRVSFRPVRQEGATE